MVRRNSIEASTQSSMAKSELIRGSVSPYQADLKFLCGDSSRLVQTTDALTEKFESIEAKMDANFNELRRTLTQLSNQLGIRPIEAETSRQTSPVTFSDAYVRDDPNRLPLVNRKSLLRKIDMPKFDGSNAYDWLSKVERFFSVGRYSDFDKLDLVALSLEGDVLKWFNWKMICQKFPSWDAFRRRLLWKFRAAPEKFSQNVAGILEERVSYTEKKGTVSTSVTESAELSSQVIGLDKSHLEELFSTGLQTEMQEVLKLKEPMGLENNKPAVLRMETGSFCQLLSEATSKPWGNQQIFTSKPAASVHSLSFEVGTEETMSSGLSQNRQVWEPGGVLSDHVLVDNVEAGSKGLAYDGCVIWGMNCAGFGRGNTELLATGQQMQRTDLFSDLLKDSSNGGAESFPILNDVIEHSFLWLQKTSETYLIVSEFEKQKQMLGYKTRMFKYKSSLRHTRFKSREMKQFVGFMTFQLKHKWRSKHRHKFQQRKKLSLQLQAVLEQILQVDHEDYTMIFDKLQGVDLHGASSDRLFPCQQSFSSIWHRWRRKD